MAKHISQKFSFKAILSRNATYRADARTKLKGTLIYDNAAQILTGIQRRDKEMGHGALVNGLTQAQRVPTYTFDYTHPGSGQNFSVGFRPYPNEAHHVIPVEVFYDKKWTTPHLHIVKSASPDPDAKPAKGYNINNEDNIIYLPQCEGQLHYMYYHNLPDHSRSHNKFNTRVVGECDPIYDLADQALAEKDCDKKKDLRKQIYDKLKQIEQKNFDHLKGLGPNPMS